MANDKNVNTSFSPITDVKEILAQSVKAQEEFINHLKNRGVEIVKVTYCTLGDLLHVQ